MEVILYILAKTVSIYLSLVTITMLGRMLIQLFTGSDGGVLFAICYYVSEPFIVPFRILFAKLNIGQSSPLDMSFLASSVGVMVLRLALPAI